ncbi:hypothetical protein WISP_108578 [Willisornis vidua]|uniref:Uncharacterized protein n=1 Tax=Willisornis vidua TaxID=1566151 RepID=A0ABQ9CW78_9PASS|nr:hypothetical protein WISP_108578 [Willisornis vidua]
MDDLIMNSKPDELVSQMSSLGDRSAFPPIVMIPIFQTHHTAVGFIQRYYLHFVVKDTLLYGISHRKCLRRIEINLASTAEGSSHGVLAAAIAARPSPTPALQDSSSNTLWGEEKAVPNPKIGHRLSLPPGFGLKSSAVLHDYL